MAVLLFIHLAMLSTFTSTTLIITTYCMRDSVHKGWGCFNTANSGYPLPQYSQHHVSHSHRNVLMFSSVNQNGVVTYSCRHKRVTDCTDGCFHCKVFKVVLTAINNIDKVLEHENLIAAAFQISGSFTLITCFSTHNALCAITVCST